MIACAAHEFVQSRAFAAHHDDDVAGEIEAVVVAFAAFVETHNPEVLPLQLFKSADEIHHAGKAQVFGRPGAGFHGDGTQGRGAALSEDDTVHSSSICHA